MEYRENRDARRPFLSTPDSRVYFPAAAIEEARRSTARCLRRNEGVALVVGATGTGKTLLTRVLAAEFEAESLVAVVSPTRRIDAKSFWQQFLFGLRQTFCGCDETELRLMALDYLERSQRRRCVLLIDDAQNLPFRVFDELRSFVDQGAAAASQICVALFGTSVLEERLNLPPLYPFQQRIVSRSYLDSFESAEIADYIDCETRRVAGKFVFTTDAKRKVADFCKGSPRIANQLCDRALFLTAQESGKERDFNEKIGFSGDFEALERIATESVEIRTIDAPLVERAWAHLLNLPTETSRAKTGAAAGDLGDVVEFGTLEDDEEENAGFNDFVAFESGMNAGYDADVENNVEIDAENERDETNDNADWEVGANGEIEALGEEFDEELSEEESDGEVDAALEARLLQNLKIWEGAQEENVGDEEKTDANDASDASRGDRWERADALKERRDADGWKERSELASFEEVSETNAGFSESALEAVGETGEFSELDDAALSGQKPEERVFEALKSEYFNDGFLFDVNVDGEEKGETGERAKKAKPRSKTTSKTRRPIVGDDDGSRLWLEANRGGGEEERFLETQFTAESVANRVVTDEEAEAAVVDWEAEFTSLEDRAYEQILEDCRETTGDFAASDEYLSELSLLEQEIEEEANLIRRIRNIHLKLRSVRAAAERKRRRNAEETNVATISDEETANVGVELEDETSRY